MQTEVKFSACLVFIICSCSSLGMQIGEPLEGDCTRFVYEYKLMERLILFEQENKRLKERLDKLERDVKPISVAVKVRLSGKLDLATNKRVMYDVVISNVGDAYDLRKGQFVAPVNGIYMIVVQACLGTSNQWIDLDVIKDGAKVGRVFSGDHLYHSCGSEALSMNLKASDTIWIDRVAGTATVLNQDHGWNSFTAVLVQAHV